MTRSSSTPQAIEPLTSEHSLWVEEVTESLEWVELSVAGWQRRELRERLERQGSEPGQDWEVVQAEIWPGEP